MQPRPDGLAAHHAAACYDAGLRRRGHLPLVFNCMREAVEGLNGIPPHSLVGGHIKSMTNSWPCPLAA